jgi:hypothetical protein
VTEGGSDTIVPPMAAVSTAKVIGVATASKTCENECSETMLRLRYYVVSLWEVQRPGLRGEEADRGRCGHVVFTRWSCPGQRGTREGARWPMTMHHELLHSHDDTASRCIQSPFSHARMIFISRDGSRLLHWRTLASVSTGRRPTDIVLEVNLEPSATLPTHGDHKGRAGTTWL